MRSAFRSLLNQAFILPFGLLCWRESSHAQPGSVDPTFSPSLTGSKQIDSVAIQADGKILIARDIQSRGMDLPLIVRLNMDGSPDPSFDSKSVPLKRICAIQPALEGKVFVAGVFTNGILTNGLGRLNPDGTLDSSFNPDAPFEVKLDSFAALADGRVLVAGTPSEDAEDTSGILRL